MSDHPVEATPSDLLEPSARKAAHEFPQELWRLFDRYVHGEMDRRVFIEHAKKFAVGGLSVTALWESLRPNYAWAIQVPQHDARIRSEEVTVPSPAGPAAPGTGHGTGKIKGYLAAPASGKRHPAVLVVHENRGLNPYIQDVARRLAVEGYLAFAPDGLASVGGYPGDDEKGGERFKTVDREKMTEDFVIAARWLKQRPDATGKLGVVGFCFGGGIANTLATRLGDELQAAVPFYGAQPPATEVGKIKAELLIHDAALDERILAGWPAYEQALRANHIKYTHYVYEKANHGFHNDTTPRYDEPAAKLAWSRTLEIFGRRLE